MPEWLKPILEWLKDPAKYLVPIAITCATLIVLPPAAIESLGLTAISKEYKPHFSIVLLFCTSVVVWGGVRFTWGWVWKKYRAHQHVGNARKRLCTLTEDEKRVLRGYIQEKTKTRVFDIFDGVVGGLENLGVLHKSTGIGQAPHMAYNIDEWAWHYLNEHPETLV